MNRFSELSRAEILASYTVFTAVDRNYLQIFSLWLEIFERSGYLPCLHVATFDAESADFIRAKGISYVGLDRRIQDPRELYVQRLNVIASLIASGRNVIHSDADAFWLKPDLPSLIREGCDLQISIGRGMPQGAIDQWGFSLCCGFFVLHASKTAERFMGTWIDKSREVGHDQLALNNLLLDQGLAWERTEGDQTVGLCSSLELRVAAISDDLISRKTVSPRVQIYHPYLSSRSESNKLLQLRVHVEPTRSRRFYAYLRLAARPSAWLEALLGAGRRVLWRARGALAKRRRA